MIRKAQAVWQGTGRDGTGDPTTRSGILSHRPYSFKTRFESEPGTNPEEPIAKVQGLTQTKFDELAGNTEKGRPVSKVLNAEITLKATLD